ncbi:hypothetical protein PEC311524_15660 [Pectobacterium carotovorum subsp. carotovorum]|uniref:Uncharacterized protein n=1 Tax=Pectobacterium polonicum TaxID=2485124 RepID=A0ABV1PAM6_9GAMM|nr:hypothetical protein [Pectobacterium polonicum]MDC9818811.1 hypothetical protein [Pectobacterium polonicum]GKW23972.1 hypothetical protein PEC311524_15660 [Pectobacterium carotovorum subsp. carotovorum]
MIFEQAFMSLPEFLTGTPFKRYQFEGTIVTAFSMAVLQELNSRNVPNPVSLLRAEVNYPTDERKRADLHIDLRKLDIFNDDLQSYGFYENNWLEAKFCRLSKSGKPVTTILSSTFLILKDLIRLCSLVPDNQLQNDYSISGRYLLHAYQGDPSQYFNHGRNQNESRTERGWIKPLIEPGRQNIKINDLKFETTKTFKKCVGNKAGLISLVATVTNFVHIPREYNEGVYHIVLTRVEDFELFLGKRSFGRKNGKIFESGNGYGLLGPKIVNHILTD